MGIKFYCPNGHKLNVKSFLAGKKGICPRCGVKVDIPEGADLSDKDDDVPSAGGIPGAIPGLAPLPAAPAAIPAPFPGPSAAIAPAAAANPTLPVPGLAGQGAPAPIPGPVAAPSAYPSVGAPVQPAVPINPAPAIGIPGVGGMGVSGPLGVPAAAAPAPVADPIAEAPQAVWYVRPPTGGQYGPATGEIMRKWIGQGRVSGDSLVWREGWPEWQNASLFFPGLTSTSAPGPAPAPGGVPLPTAGAAPTGAVAEPAIVSPPARTYRTRRKNSSSMAIAIIAFLVLASIGLAVALVFVLQATMGPGSVPQ